MKDYQKVSKNYNFDLMLKAHKLQICCFFSRGKKNELPIIYVWSLIYLVIQLVNP